jgi:hypothetical protein
VLLRGSRPLGPTFDNIGRCASNGAKGLAGDRVIIELLRPDDLLALGAETTNLRLDTADPTQPALVRIDPAQPAFIKVLFPPQSIAEQAFFDSRNASPAQPPQPGTTTEPVLPPGSVRARICGPSRLVFRIPDEIASIAFSVDGLLDWSGWEPVLAPLATLPAQPTIAEMDQAPGVTAPEAGQTSIEMPYRLMVSPGERARWIHTSAPVTHRGRTELWHTALAQLPDEPAEENPRRDGAPVEASLENPVAIRAIWSPDYRAPGETPLDGTSDLRPFRMTIKPTDRHQIVARCVGCHELIESNGRRAIPAPVNASRLFLTALGGYLRSRGSWGPAITIADELAHSRWLELVAAAAARAEHPREPDATELLRLLPNLPATLISTSPLDRRAGLLDVGDLLAPGQLIPDETLSLSDWTHVATQGRDHYVRIVHEGRLYPFGHRAALVTVTERRFEAAPPGGTSAGAPVAYLRQRKYIIVREPERAYFTDSNTRRAREMPLGSRVRLTTLVTPNLEDPDKPPAVIAPSKSFWVRADGQDFRFHVVVRDMGKRDVDFTAALIFIDDRAAGAADYADVSARYEADTNPETGAPRRACEVPGQKIAFAQPSDEQPEDTTLATSALYFSAKPEQPKFEPNLERADVRIPSLEHLLGASATTSIRLYGPYVEGSFDANAGVFAELIAPLGVKFSADKAGGIATPNLSVSGISRAFGPVAGALSNAAAGAFVPSDFFPTGLPDAARIFGAVSLGDLIPSGALSVNAPKIRTEVSPPAPAVPREVVTSLDWAPQVSTGTFASVLITRPGTSLQVHARIIAPIGGGTSRMELSGALTSFDITLAGVILIKFDAFRFSAANGAKPDVGIELASSDPVQFQGALAFVAALSELIPRGAFGSDGPSVELAPTALKVGYGIGLPDLSIGVFALHGLRFAAALTLPFLSGKPQLDFAFAERHHPFLLTVECLGGGGFVHLTVDASGVIMVEGAFEFGGAFSLDIGVASGGVHVLAGFYFKLEESRSELAGFFDLGGEVTVLGIISVSVNFNLTLAYISQGGHDKVRGSATVTVAVSIFGLSKSVSLTVEKSFGSASGDPPFGQMFTPVEWQDYSAAFA